ncbi:hypothetical protein IJH02_00765 [Candidatus Saccharibacteria bacterium]|nr:hypothetical protein [Candidatus Saccharibacteria bacterium]
MVCIAAFIILILVGVVVAFLSIFNRDLGRKYLKVLKKSWHCFTRRISFRKCDTSFSEDVKTTLLKKVVIKKPKLVKPLSVALEVGSILIVVITVWSLIEGAKAGLALWTLGTCNVNQPANCALGSEICSLEETNLNWFEEWGEIFKNIPDRLKNWSAEDYFVEPMPSLNKAENPSTTALDIFDPGCPVCMQSYKNQLKNQNFLNKHKIYLMIYPIKLSDGNYKYQNSGIIAKYFNALTLLSKETETASKNPYKDLDAELINRIFTEEDQDGVNYQSAFNNNYSKETAEKTIKDWLGEWGLSADEVKRVTDYANGEEVKSRMAKIAEVVENEIKPKGIPTLIYDGKKHLGLYK